MAQIAIIQPVAPQPPPPGPPANDEQQQFSPHFEKALANKKDQLKSRESEGKANERTIKQNEIPNKNNEITSTATDKTTKTTTDKTTDTATNNTGQDSLPAVAETPKEEVSLIDQNLPQTASENQSVNTAINPSINTPIQIVVEISPLCFFAPGNRLIGNSLENIQPVTFSPGSETSSLQADGIANPLSESLNFSLAQSDQLLVAVQPTPLTPESDKLLLQIQQLIEESNETGTVSITADGNSRKTFSGSNGIYAALTTAISANEPLFVAPTSGEASQSDSDGPMLTIANGFEVPYEKGNQGLTSLRQNTQQQYYEAKVALQQGGENETTPQDSRQGNGFSQKDSTTPGLNTPAIAGADQTNTFAQPLGVMQDGQLLPANESARPITLPSGAVVHQDEVFRQIIERFQLSRSVLDTRINIKLHPAELGELNINLSVKEGSIRANVVAQSQHVQEIIEKNMGRLRTVLENQGFTIEDISVTAKSDAVGDFNLFDRQLFSQNDYTPPSPKNSRNAGTFFSLEEPGIHGQTAVAGVNVKI